MKSVDSLTDGGTNLLTDCLIDWLTDLTDFIYGLFFAGAKWWLIDWLIDSFIHLITDWLTFSLNRTGSRVTGATTSESAASSKSPMFFLLSALEHLSRAIVCTSGD